MSRNARRGALPKGAGGVRCPECKAEARADGKGTPIVLRHKSDCPLKEHIRKAYEE